MSELSDSQSVSDLVGVCLCLITNLSAIENGRITGPFLHWA